MITKILEYLGLRPKQPLTKQSELIEFMHRNASFVSQVTLFKEIASASQTPATEREEFGKRLCSQRKKREKLRRWALSGPGR